MRKSNSFLHLLTHRESFSFHEIRIVSFAAFAACVSISGFLPPHANCADQVVKDKSGSVFMEEVAPQKSTGKIQNLRPTTPAKPALPAQVIRGESGSIFMEEVPEQRKTPKPKSIDMNQFDLQSLGVPVDPKGRIVPLIQPESGPVLNNSSRMTVEYMPRQVYVPVYSPYSVPLGYGVNRSPYGNYAAPIFGNPLYGYVPVPLGIPRYFSSSSDVAPGSELTYGSSGSYLVGQANFPYPPQLAGPFSAPFSTPYAPGGSIWNPNWRSPWSNRFGIPQITQYQNQGSIKPLFPSSLSD